MRLVRKQPEQDPGKNRPARGEPQSPNHQRAGKKAALAGHQDDRRRGREARDDKPSPIQSARHRQEIKRECREHEQREGRSEGQSSQRRQQSQERRRIGERIELVRIHAERDLIPVQRVRVVIQRGRAALRKLARGPKRIEIAEMVGLMSGDQQFEANEQARGKDRSEARERQMKRPVAQLEIPGRHEEIPCGGGLG